jgi:enoyl-CoA hydratase/carnithine racemase
LTVPVRVERDGPVAVVTVDSPPVNAIGDAVLDGLAAAAAAVGADDGIRAVVLTGAGEKAFLAGADLNELQSILDGSVPSEEYTARVRAVLEAWERLPQPVVAAVQASGVGGGLEVALVCDLIVADPRARFGLPEVRLGLMPGAGGTQRLLRRVPLGAARELLLLGGTIDAETALRLGLADRVAAPGAALDEAHELAGRIAALPALATRAIKRAVSADLEPGLDREGELFRGLLGSADAREGVAAFVERREPRFNRAE